MIGEGHTRLKSGGDGCRGKLKVARELAFLMILLHVADIHFRHPECAGPMDPDRPYRTMLLRHVKEQVSHLGSIDAILVGGDIAFRGIAEEYEAARLWLAELAEAGRCSLDDIFVVPGNHDVNRDVIRHQADVRNAQAAILNAQAGNRERELINQFRDARAGASLLAPVGAYNQFAAQFNCQVYAPDKLFWHQDRVLSPSVKLRIFGLTSTLLSGAGAPRNVEDTKLSLYLSPFQTVLDPVDGVVNLVLGHHPPDWFLDHDDVDDAIQGRAALHFFGHKHRQRIHCDTGYVRFAAGAVNPDRREPGWEPGYNIVEVAAEDEEHGFRLQVKAHLFAWQTNPDGFHPKVAHDGGFIFRHSIPVRRAGRGPIRQVPQSTTAAAAQSATMATLAEAAQPAADPEVVMSEPRTRNLVFRFWSLSSSQRRDIAKGLGLITDDDMRLPEPERYGRALIAAGERGLLEKVAEAVERMEGNANG